MSALLELQHVSKTFTRGGLFSSRRIVAVNDVSFQIDAARPEIFTIIGESGSGKTTLSRMILNIETPTSGRLACDGIDLATMSLIRRARVPIHTVGFGRERLSRDAEISAERANGLALIGPRVVRIRSIFGTGCPCSFVLASRNVHAARRRAWCPIRVSCRPGVGADHEQR